MDFKEEYLRLLREQLTDYKRDAYPYYKPTEDDQKSNSSDTVNCKKLVYEPLDRFYGKDWPQHGETMVGLVRLVNLQELVKIIASKNVEGDFFEAGVWRGGASIYLHALNKAYCEGKKDVWLADSFEGLPPSTYSQDQSFDFTQFDELSVSLDTVKNNFKKYNLLDPNIHFVKGWFKDSLPTVQVDKIALLRLDGDLYESTINILTNLYDKVSVGGYIVVDDYSLDCCKQAIHDFRKERNISDKIVEVDWTGVYWKKS